MPNGLFAARTIRKLRKKFAKVQRVRFSSKAEGKPMLKGLVIGKKSVECRQPNSALRKCVKIQLTCSGKVVTAFAPGDLAIKYISEHDEVLIAGIKGTLGKSRGDLPGVSFKVIKVNNLSLIELVRGKKVRANV